MFDLWPSPSWLCFHMSPAAPAPPPVWKELMKHKDPQQARLDWPGLAWPGLAGLPAHFYQQRQQMISQWCEYHLL